MREHVAPVLYYLEVHLLYASIVCVAAWILTSLWKGGETAKYWIWVVTSVNFMVPFGGFFNGFGSAHFSWATQLAGLDRVGYDISQNLSAGAVLVGVWLCGAGFMAMRLLVRLPRGRGSQGTPSGRNAMPFRRRVLTRDVPIILSAPGQGPSVEGVLRPHIALPRGIELLVGVTRDPAFGALVAFGIGGATVIEDVLLRISRLGGGPSGDQRARRQRAHRAASRRRVGV